MEPPKPSPMLPPNADCPQCMATLNELRAELDRVKMQVYENERDLWGNGRPGKMAAIDNSLHELQAALIKQTESAQERDEMMQRKMNKLTLIVTALIAGGGGGSILLSRLIGL